MNMSRYGKQAVWHVKYFKVNRHMQLCSFVLLTFSMGWWAQAFAPGWFEMEDVPLECYQLH